MLILTDFTEGFNKVFCNVKRRTFIVLCMLMLFVANGFAQNIAVKGKVVDEANEPVIGVSVQVQGTTNGVITDLDGNYTLNNVSGDDALVFSYVGMESQTIPVNGKSVVNVTMKENTVMLEETVVIGYGSIKKSNLTGAVSVVKTDDFKNRSVTSVGDALQGTAAGVTVRSGGDLGDLPAIQIRGTGNLTNTDPLYVIDGVPTSNDIGFNVNDIESIQVLKDASSAAIYGSRAANGVIIITTKKGQEGKPRIEYSTQIAIQSIRQLDFINGDEWRDMMSKVYQNGLDKHASTEAIPDFWKNNTDWQDEYMKTGVQQEHNLAISGGSKDSKFRVSFGVMDNPGYTIGRDMRRFTTSINSEFKLGIFKLGESIQFGKHRMKFHNYVNLDEVVRMTPIIGVKDDVYGKNGWGYGNKQFAYTNAHNVVAHADDSNGYNRFDNIYVRASAWAEVALTKWLTYKLNLGATLNDNDSNSWNTGYDYGYGFTDVASSANASASRTWNYLVENTISFNKKIGSHNIAGVLGQSYQDSQYRSLGSGKTDLIKSAGGFYLKNVDGGITLSNAAGSSSQHRLISYFGRINYDYDDRYLLQATVRRDGTSRFAKGAKWGTFPSISLGWHISKERFYNIDWMNELKLRVNYGTLGSQNVGNYDYQSLINSYTGYAYNGGLVLSPGQAITDAANVDISWEKKETMNVGLDMNFFNNRLQTSLEYYISKSKDVLYAQSILKTVGSVSNPIVNSASIENKGVELSATWRDKINTDWSYSVGINLSHNKNTLTGLGYGVDSYDAGTTLSKVGEPIGLFYLIKTDGLYQTDAEAQADGVINNAVAGDVKFIDFDESGSINDGDRQLLTDKSPWPKLEASLNITVNYKNWSAQIFGFGQFFRWVYNGTRLTTDGLSSQTNIRRDYYKNTWSEHNKHNNVWYPRTGWGYTFNDLGNTDRWLERGDFFKFSTLSLSYNYKPTGFLASIIRGAKISVTAQNFLCFTGFSGYDPDFRAGMFTPGNAGNSNPSPRSLIFGLNLNF